MKKKQGVSDTGKKKIGRPRVGATGIMVRLPPDQLAALDAWMKRHQMYGSRPEAIRRLIERGVAGTAMLAETQGTAAAPAKPRRKATGKPAAAKAASLRSAKPAVRAKAAAAKRPARRQA